MVVAPAGKLGIVLDTTMQGPMVNNVKEGSAMQGILFPGDIIVQIGEEETKAMNAAAINSIMIRTAGAERKLMVLRASPASDGEIVVAPGVTSASAPDEEIVVVPLAGAAAVRAGPSDPVAPTRDASSIVNDSSSIVVDSKSVGVASASSVVAVSGERKSDTQIPKSISGSPQRSISSALKATMEEHDIEAPPGKMGIVIDTTLEGPMIHTVKPGGPMAGKMFAGDIIVKINGEETKAMNSTAINAIMVKTSGSTRYLTVLRAPGKSDSGVSNMTTKMNEPKTSQAPSQGDDSDDMSEA